jgi:hypothetical protein
MNNSVPDYTKTNFSVEKEKAEEMIDFGVQLYTERNNIREINKKMYDSYNGILNKKEIERIVKKSGRTSGTPLIPYRIGRNKVKQLIGEFLQIGIRSTVYTVNPEAKKQKYDKYIQYKGMAHAKPMIEKARQQGLNVYSGLKIPDEKELKISSEKFKSTNEIIMQTLIDWKVIKDDLLSVFGENWKQLILTSEMCGKLERDKYFNDIFRPIDPNDAIFIESPFDPLVKRSFIIGERRLMFKHEILQEFAEDFENNAELEEMLVTEGNSMPESSRQTKSGEYLYEVFSFQFLGKKTMRKKESIGKNGEKYIKFIKEDEYKTKKGSIEHDIKKGKYKIIDEYDQYTIFEGSRIGTDIYVGIKEKENNIVWTDDNGFDHIEFDYVFGLFNTVDGVRIPLQEIIHEMEKVYDAIRRQLNVEISKLKGDMAVFDEAFMTSKNPLSKTIHDLAEHGITSMNSSKEGVAPDDETNVIDRFVKSFKLGDNSTIQTLISLALDIEQTLDRVIGMNADRQGVGNASSTATTNQNNVNASVSMTYDLFHFASIYMNEVISRLLEKIKINWTWIQNQDYGMILSDEQYGFLKATKDLSNDSFGAFVTDGKFEYDVRQKLEQFFLQEINAQNLRTLDVAKFYNSKSFAQALKVLEDGYNILSHASQQAEQQKIQSNNQNTQAQIAAQKEGREDEQSHDIEKIRVKGEEDRKTKLIDKKMESSIIANEHMRNHLSNAELERERSDLKRDELASKERIESIKEAKSDMNDNNNNNNNN